MTRFKELSVKDRYNIYKRYQVDFPEMSPSDIVKHYDGGGEIGILPKKEQNQYTKAEEPPEKIDFPYDGTSKYKGGYDIDKAKEIYNTDETGHLPSVDYRTGQWLKHKDYPTAWKEFYSTQMNMNLQKEVGFPILNENNRLQYTRGYKEGGPIVPPDGDPRQAYADSLSLYNSTNVLLKALQVYNDNPSNINRTAYFNAQNRNTFNGNKGWKYPITTHWTEQNAPDGNPDFYWKYPKPTGNALDKTIESMTPKGMLNIIPNTLNKLPTTSLQQPSNKTPRSMVDFTRPNFYGSIEGDKGNVGYYYDDEGRKQPLSINSLQTMGNDAEPFLQMLQDTNAIKTEGSGDYVSQYRAVLKKHSKPNNNTAQK